MNELSDLDRRILYLFRKLPSERKREFMAFAQELLSKEQETGPDYTEKRARE